MLNVMDARDSVDVVAARPSPSPSSLVTDADGVKSMAVSTPNGIRSSPPTIYKEIEMDLEPSRAPADDADAKSDSEAETIVLPGKDGHSPSKIRKSIKHEDKSDDEGLSNAPGGGSADEDEAASKVELDGSESPIATTSLGKRKRAKHKHNKDNPAHPGDSSGLSSIPTSPVATIRSLLSKPAPSDSDISRSPSPNSPYSTGRGKANSVDRIVPRRKDYASGSGDEGEPQRYRRQRSSGADHKQARDREDRGSSSKQIADPRKRARSISPPTRSHRRSISTQLSSKSTHGLSHKKKRIPAPLQSTEYLSDESSASGSSSHPRSSRLRHLAAPVTGESNISPAKMAPHKKRLDHSGQTRLYRACASGKLDTARQLLKENSEDLNEGDNANNTPLHGASLEGHSEVVKLLLDAGCMVDPINLARDTPLHDAIENGHVDVVKLLLEAGANPRKANGKGEDPYDLVNDASLDDSEAAEIKEAITAAKLRSYERRSSEDEQMNDAEGRMSHPKESPRQTPPAHELQFSTSRRNGTTRAVKTSDRILYQPLNLSELRRAAGINDTDTVIRILDVHSNDFDDPKSLIIAAKAGHHQVVEFLLALGNFNPDPEPIALPAEGSTPILAAIGRENIQVIELLVNHENFDPTRRVHGETYYEIAKRRNGQVSKEEEALLKKAFDSYKTTHKSSPKKSRSSGARREGREADRDTRRAQPTDEPESSRSHKRTTSSPKLKDQDLHKNQHKRTSSTQSKDLKRGPGRPRKEESAAEAFSDRENTSLGPPKQKSQVKRSESEVAVASESESTAKPRRKLVSGKDLRGERELEKQRRVSVASNASGISVKERHEGESKMERSARRASPSVPRKSNTGHHEQDFTSENAQSENKKSRPLKRDDSKDRITAIRGKSPAKRPRKSTTPPRSNMQDICGGYESDEVPQKRRKLAGDSKSGRAVDSASSSSPDRKTSTAKDSLDKPEPKQAADRISHSSHKQVNSPDIPRHAGDEAARNHGDRAAKLSKSKSDGIDKDIVMEDADSAALKADEEREARKMEFRREQEREKKEKAENEKKLEEDRIEEQARKARLAREQVEREEEAKRRQDEADQKERQLQKDAEATAREQERQKALYQEQERIKKEEQERRRAMDQERKQAEKIRIEKQKRQERLDKLPLLLRWFDEESYPRTLDNAALFRFIEGFRYDTINPAATGLPNGREEWMLNTQAALLLGEKDLQLSRYTAWEHIPLSTAAKEAIWKFENPLYSLTQPNLLSLRLKYPYKADPQKIFKECEKLWLDLDLFFIKVSEFMYVVPNFPHLRGLELVVKYRELQELPVWPPPPGKWKQDPDTDPRQIFAPRPKYYVNGNFVKQGEVQLGNASATPFGERRVPRRGLVQVFPGENDYEQLAKKQGLGHLIAESPKQSPQQSHQQPNGTTNGHGQANGITPPDSDNANSVHGGSPNLGTSLLVNGFHDVPMENAPSINSL